MRRTLIRAWWALPTVLCVVALAVASVTPAADTPVNADKREKPGAKLEVGKPAPDFELPVLKQELNDKGEKVDRITDEKVKLSSFRGKKVVCLFMSSYT
jgi:hypothetical protein